MAAVKKTAEAGDRAPRGAPGNSGPLLASGDRAWERKSYAVALRAYREALRGGGVPRERRPQIEYRVARCLGATKQWDAALTAAGQVTSRYKGTVWDARSRAWLMQVFLSMPHSGWKVGDRLYRGEEMPKTEAEARPEPVDLTQEDTRKTVQYGEQAKALYEKLRGGPTSTIEEAALAADLARVVAGTQVAPWAQALAWKAPADASWKLDENAPYDPSWAPPKKVLQLYLNAEKLGNKEQKGLARLAQALWLRGYHAYMGSTAVKTDEKGEAQPLPYPYQDRPALPVLRSMIRDYTAHPEADHAWVMLGQWLEQDGKYEAALGVYRSFLKDRPQSKWASDAQAATAEITRLALEIEAPQPQPPGKKATLEIQARNVKSLKFTAHRIKLEELVKDARILQRPREGIQELFARLDRLKGIRKFYQGDPITWETPLVPEKAAAADKDKGAAPPDDERAPLSKKIETPLARTGAYVVEADGGPVRSAVVLVISDLAVLQIVEGSRAHAMVVNAETGAPVYGASTLIREVYQDDKGKDHVSAQTSTANADGMAEKGLAPGRSYSQDVLTFAWKGERYAFTGGGSSSPDRETRESSRVYVYTERPVYRPAQTVYYRALLASRKEAGDWKPVAGQKATVQVRDPRGNTVATQAVTSGEFGSVSGKMELTSGAPLGAYSLLVSWSDEKPDGKNEKQTVGSGSASFRVEEYKKPEFEVTVAPGTPAGPDGAPGVFRVGDPVTAKIVARYYFGAPVAKAKVKYTVTRSEWIPESPFKGPYDFLYESRTTPSEHPWWDPDWIAVPEGEVASGTVTTDAKGEATVKFDTDLKDPRLKGRHLKFAIHAEVTDASRRTIEGSGEVRALASQFNAFLQLHRGFYSVGDRLQADVRTLDANGRPVSVSGTARVLRLTAKTDEAGAEKTESEEVYQEPLKTDAQGRATFQWTASRDGSYEVRFEARDAWEQLVIGRERAWVAGEGAGAGVFHNKHVLLIPEETSYRIGQTARVLLVADEPNATVLLTQEAGSRLLEKRVIRMTGRSQVVEIPLTRRLSPDVVLAANGVRDRELFRSQATLYVPPAEGLLNVEVAADKGQYKPGEKALFRLRARDADGKGVRTEASVGVVDASVFYIQGDVSPAIASFFYAGERGSNLNAEESLSQQFDTVQEDDQPPAKWERHEWQFPDTLGNLPTAGEYNLLAAHEDMYGNSFADDGILTRHGVRRSFQIGGTYGRVDRDSRRLNGAPGTTLAMPEMAAGGAPAPQSPAPAKKKDAAGAVNIGFRAAGEAPSVRKNFADTAFWSPAVVTDANGDATVEVTWPDNLTEWRATTRAWTDSVQVGEASTDVSTSKDLLVRLQAPRFFVERDELVLSANVHNYTDADRKVRVVLQMEGETLYPASAGPSGPPAPRRLSVPRADRELPASDGSGVPAPETGSDSAASPNVMEQSVDVPRGGERRVDWRVRVERPGEAKIRVLADSGAENDAVEMKFPVYVHGIEKLIVKSGSMLMAAGEKPGARSARLSLDLPAERSPDSGELTVQLTPSTASAMLDALPYLVDYPYGCTEQTMSRFMPCVISSRTLTDLGLDLQVLQKRAEQEYTRVKQGRAADQPEGNAYSYPAGSPGSRDVEHMNRELWQWRAEKSPVYRPEILKSMVAEGLARLRKFQHSDGGWGWWETDASNGRMTAYVLQGLVTGKAAGLEVPQAMLDRGFAYLEGRFQRETQPHDIPYFGWVLTMDAKRAPAAGAALLERVYPKRERLTPYSLALLALGLKGSGHLPEARVCMENLENEAKLDRDAGTCYWPQNDGGWWNWYNDDVETAATCLRVFNALDPKHALAPMVVRWLCNHRSGNAWDSTRQTALAIYSLAEYVKVNKELSPDYTVTVDVAGRFKRSFKVNTENALLFENRLVVPAAALGSGPQAITVKREGQGSLYYTAYLRYFTLEEGIRASGEDLKVRRRYFRLVKPAAGTKAAGLTEDGYARSLVKAGERLTSGDLLEVELLIENKNAYEYLVFEDMKPSGCEPVDLRSGTRYGGGLCSNMELRDQKVAFFVTWLPQGRRMLTYRLRAEIPGTFHALPLNAYAMYAPELRAISEESNLGIDDAPEVDLAREGR
jgi:uncharacterized protein YfaS (alpha-2-macroglobulin family)